MVKPGRYVIDPQGREVYVIDIIPDLSGDKSRDMVKVRLAGPYGARVTYPRSVLRPVAP